MAATEPQVSASARVGFIGLGAMGYPMAGHIHRHCMSECGQPCVVWNRTAETAQRHAAEHGTEPAASLAGLSASCRVVVMCLPTSADVATVLGPLVNGGLAGKCLVDCTSGDPDKTQALARTAEERGHEFVDAPVSGGPAGAAAGALAVLAGGTDGAVARARPLLESFAKKLEHVGAVGAGHAVKSINNALNATHLLAGAEGLLALQRFGVAPARALAAINLSSGRSLQTEARLPQQVLTRKFGYGFKLGLMLKDLRIAQRLVAGTALPCTDTGAGGTAAHYFERTEALLAQAVADEGADVDYTRCCAVLEKAAGAELRREES